VEQKQRDICKYFPALRCVIVSMRPQTIHFMQLLLKKILSKTAHLQKETKQFIFIDKNKQLTLLKGQCHEIFVSACFFHESVFPQPQSIQLGPFQIFSKIRGDIFSSQGAPPVSTTSVENNGNNIRLL
jgi:hypothetical protein